MAEAKRDSNRIPTLLGVSSVDGVTPVNVYVDPVTHRLLIDSATVGTVTSVSVVTANGVSGSVATATTTPAITLTLGAITPSSVNKVTITAPATSATLTIANGKTLTVNNTITFTATDGSTLAIGAGGTLGSAAYTASTAYAASTHASTHAVGGADSVFPADPGADKYLKFNNTSNAIEWADVAGGGDMILADVQTVTGLKTFDKEKVAMKGTSTGKTTISTANTSATDYTQTLQAKTGTIANSDDVTYIGTTSVALNRSSAALTLAGITLTTPDIGTPSAGVLTNCTGLPVAGLANGTDGELITWDSSGVATTVAVGTAGQVLTSNGAGAAPTFQAASGGGAAQTSLIPKPDIPFDLTAQGSALAANTTMGVAAYIIPYSLTISKITFRRTTFTSGAIKLAMYSEDGQTKVFEGAVSDISATNINTATLGTPVTITPGIYYIAYLGTGTVNFGVSCWKDSTTDAYGYFSNTVSGEAIKEGTITVTADTIPATITPASITAGSNLALMVRFD